MKAWWEPKPTDGIVSRYINRKISTRITKLLLEKAPRLTPNTVSVISALLGWIAALLIIVGQNVIGGVLIQVSSIIDGVDGELARATGRVTRLGGFVDSMLDRYVDIAIIMALAFSAIAYSGVNSLLALLVSCLALSGDLMVSYLHARGEASLGKHPALIGSIRGVATRDVRLLIAAIAAIVNMPFYGLVVIALLSHMYTIAKIIEVLGTYRA